MTTPATTLVGETGPEPWWTDKTIAENLAYQPPPEVPVVLWVGDTAAHVGTSAINPDTWRATLPALLRRLADEMDRHDTDKEPDRG